MNKVDEQKKVEQAFDTVRRILFDNVHEGRAVGLDLWRYDNGGWEWFKDYQFPEKGKAPAKREESGTSGGPVDQKRQESEGADNARDSRSLRSGKKVAGVWRSIIGRGKSAEA